MIVGAWSMTVILWQKFEHYYYIAHMITLHNTFYILQMGVTGVHRAQVACVSITLPAALWLAITLLSSLLTPAPHTLSPTLGRVAGSMCFSSF